MPECERLRCPSTSDSREHNYESEAMKWLRIIEKMNLARDLSYVATMEDGGLGSRCGESRFALVGVKSRGSRGTNLACQAAM